jgi:parallel beta-helix repeat protein
MVVVNNVVHHNNQFGMLSANSAKNALVEGNEISYNNFRGAVDHLWAAGGTKFLKTTDLVLRNNYVHHNTGPGLWLDVDNIGAIYEGNVVSDNSYHGIHHEISYRAIIRNNEVSRNGAAGIWVNGSSDVEVYGNTVIENGQFGIGGNQDFVGSGAHGPWAVQNLYVHDNSITQTRGWTGVQQQVGDMSYFTSRNNRFQANTYVIGSNPRPFAWMGSTRTKAEWLAYGHDTNAVWAG